MNNTIKTTKCPVTGLPVGDHPPALDFPHFPSRAHAVIWRNWRCVTPTRLAEALQTTPEEVGRAAAAMGLGDPGDEDLEQRWLKRGYITLIRQNWHLLPYPQLLDLLGWEPERLAFALKEDDFLWNKLGRLKPEVETVRLEPVAPEKARLVEVLKEIALSHPGAPGTGSERAFDFIQHYGKAKALPASSEKSSFELRLAYSYSALYGDPFLDAELDPFPDGLLSDLAASGVNAIWLQGTLYTLVPWFGESSWSKGHETRIRNLNDLIDKAARHGIGLYLYLNEPRSMPPEFFEEHPEWGGGFYPPTGMVSMCTSHPEILPALGRGVSELFERAPGLAGVFTITMSENLTHCHSKERKEGGLEPCPRCEDRGTEELVVEVNNTIAQAVHRVKPEAEVVVWNWSWGDEWWRKAVSQLDPKIRLMCTSETSVPTNAMGVEGKVGDYSISKVGPGPHATAMWQEALERGLQVLAKVQLNTTWECSALPYLPVPFLVKKHLDNLRDHHVSGLMVSWTLGGYPGGNLALIDHAPEELAREWFGSEAAEGVLAAWKQFGEAFEEFPLHGAPCLYTGPQNYGPMNLLFSAPSGYPPTMVGFPYDGIDRWRGNHFPIPVFEAQFEKLSNGWKEGLSLLEKVKDQVPAEKAAAMEDLRNVAEAAYCHFRSAYLQIRFVHVRDSVSEDKKPELLIPVLDEEIELAGWLLHVMRRDSRIGFEATNHYHYTEAALMEKIANCRCLKKLYEN